ncbi:MAG: hypothetical protein ACRDTR_18840 [Rubrobacter sp.]
MSDNTPSTSRRLRAFGTLTMVGGGTLMVGATLADLSSLTGLPSLGSVGFALSAGAGLGLLFLPVGLWASGVGGGGVLARAGAVCLLIGLCLVSLVDIPAIFDPSDLEAGGALGPVGLVILSVGFLAWFAAIRRAGILFGWRRYIFLAAGLWFFVTFPTVQLPLFVIPNGRPSFVLLAGVLGIIQLMMGMILREQAVSDDAPNKLVTSL